MKDYMLLIRGGDARMAELTEEQTQEHMAKWGAYMGGLQEKGLLLGGLPFTQDGRILSNRGAKEGVVLSDAGEPVGGYLMIKGEDYDHALASAKECPVFEHDGTVEIREILPMEM